MPSWTQRDGSLNAWHMTGGTNSATASSFSSYGPVTLAVETQPFAADAARAVRLTARLSNATPALFSWTADGKSFNRRFLLPGGAQWRSTLLSLSRADGWSGQIASLSLQLESAAENRVEIAALQVLPQANLLPDASLQNDTAPLLWWHTSTLWQTRTHELRPRARYSLAGEAEVRFLDSDGHALSTAIASTGAPGASFVVPDGVATALISAKTLEAARRTSLVQVGAADIETPDGEDELPRAQWIWYPEPAVAGTRVFRRDFTLQAVPDEASLVFSADDGCLILVNGQEAGRNTSFKTTSVADVKTLLRAGKNHIAIIATNNGGPGAALAELWTRHDAAWGLVSTDAAWQAARATSEDEAEKIALSDDGNWLPANELGRVPVEPWRGINYEYHGPRGAANLAQKDVTWDDAKREVRYVMKFSGPASQHAWISVKRGDNVIAEHDLGAMLPQGREYHGALSLQFAEAGDADVILDAPYTALRRQVLARVVVPPAPLQGFASTRFLQTPRGPTLDIDGFRAPIHFYVTPANYRYDPQGQRHYLSDAAKMGLHLQGFDVPAIGFDGEMPSWPAEGRYDFSKIDELCETALAADPQARLVLRLALDAPNWWVKAHPDDISRTESGGRENLHPVWARQSIGSQAWQRDARAYLVALTQHMKSRPYAPRVWSLLFCTSGAIEWVSEVQPNNPTDYSVAGTQGWRDWLRREYLSDEALRHAWGDEKVSLETAKVPPSSLRFASESGDYRDPTRGARSSIDYVRYLDARITDLMLDGARAIRESSDERLEVGVYYGYHFFGSTIYSFLHQAGHNSFARVLESPDILFCVGPVSYRTRFSGMATTPMSAADAAEQHGKFWVQEEDTRTYLETLPNEYDNGRPDTFYDSVHAMRRDFGQALCSGWGVWWYEMLDSWLRDPDLRREIARMRAAQDFPANANATPRAQIAVVIDEKSVPFAKDWHSDTPQRVAVHDQLQAFNRSGAPFQTVLLSDLLAGGKAPSYRAYFFLDAWRVSPAARTELHERFKRDKAIVLWQWGAGLFEGESSAPSVDAASQLTGFALKLPDAMTDVTHFQALENAPLMRDLQPEDFGHRSLQSTRLVPHDGEVLATLANGEAALTQKSQDGWDSIYLAVPNIPVNLIRNIAHRAGLQEYSQNDDVLTAGHGFITLHARTAGRKTLNLPVEAEVWDALQNRRLAERTKTFSYQSEAGETRIFALK